MPQSPSVLCELQDVLATRRGQVRMRMGLALAIGLSYGQIAGWGVSLGWIAVYGLLQVVEHRWLARSKTAKPVLAMLALNSLVFGAYGMLGPISDGAWGLAAGVCLLCGGMLNTALSTQKSRTAFLASFAPFALMLASMPIFALYLGAAARHATIMGIAAVFISAAVVMISRGASRAMAAEGEARARAEAADAAKSAFVAMVSHELRTPISAMLAGAAEAGTAPTETERRANLELISASARMMRMLLNDLLDLSKLEAGRMAVEDIGFDLRRLVEEAGRFWGPEARKRDLDFRLEGDDRLPHGVRGDPNRIRQILNNLLSNALKFTETGEVALLVEAEPSPAGLGISITVADTGVGMSPEQAGRLFEPFTQAHASVARTHGGTGLGLSISRELARLMGGDLTVDSTAGHGSAFRLTLILAVDESSQPSGEDEPLPEGLRILVADDHPMNRRALEIMLTPLGAEVTLAVDGQEAVELVGANTFDLVFLDLNMPRMGGLDAARAIRRQHGDVLPLVALTASVSEADMNACTQAGMNGFVGKPLEATELYEAIAAVLRKGPARFESAAA